MRRLRQLLRKWDRPWVDDVLMVSPTDRLGHIAFLVVVDNVSQSLTCEQIPVKSFTAESLARECVKVFGRTNTPITIRSDQGPALCSRETLGSFRQL